MAHYFTISPPPAGGETDGIGYERLVIDFRKKMREKGSVEQPG
jgi:hypothetical protein